mgnify:CR=1 FL=1
MEIGNRIQELRKKKNISQEELANIMNVSRQAVSKWESNLSAPDIEKIVDLCEYFQVSSDYLLMGKETKKMNDTWKKFYPLLSLWIKVLVLIAMILFSGFFILSGLSPIVLVFFMPLMVIIYLLEQKFMEEFSLDNRNIFYDLGMITYSYPFILPISGIIYEIFYHLVVWLKEITLNLHRKNLDIVNFKHIFFFVRDFEAYLKTFDTRMMFIVLMLLIVNLLIIRHIRKRNLSQK